MLGLAQLNPVISNIKKNSTNSNISVSVWKTYKKLTIVPITWSMLKRLKEELMTNFTLMFQNQESQTMDLDG